MFSFENSIDPKNPISASDPPPDGWEFIDAHDYSGALFGFPSDCFTKCVEWQKRELLRKKVLTTEGFQYNIEVKIDRTLTEAQKNRLKWLLENAAKEIFCEPVMTGKIIIQEKI